MSHLNVMYVYASHSTPDEQVHVHIYIVVFSEYAVYGIASGQYSLSQFSILRVCRIWR